MQFDTTHVVANELETGGFLHLALAVMNAWVPEPRSTNWTPPGTTCDFTLQCSSPICYGDNINDGSPTGPMAFNSAPGGCYYPPSCSCTWPCRRVCENGAPNNWFVVRCNNNALGLFSSLTNQHAKGWAADPDMPFTKVYVDVYVEDPPPSLKFLGRVLADQFYSGGTPYGNTCGWQYSLPTKYRTGMWTFHALAWGAEGGTPSAELPGSPKTRW